MVATVSRRLPQAVASDPTLSLDINMGMNMPGTSQLETFNDLERLGDDSVIEVIEARLGTVNGSSQLSK